MSKIKKIEIHNLLNPDSPIKKWDINKSLYLYGPNGVGKTTLLDSLYAAIQNDLSIFEYHDSKTNESNSRKLLYNKLIITFQSGNELNILGSIIVQDELFDAFKEIFNKIKTNLKTSTIIQDKEFEQISKNFNILIKEYHYIENIENDVPQFEFKKEQNKKLLEFINKIINNEKKKDMLEPYEENIMNIIRKLNHYYMIYKNEQNKTHRRKYSEEFDVVYLTIDRTKPKSSGVYSDKDFYYYGNKSQITPSIEDIVKELKTKIDQFNIKIFEFNKIFLEEILKIEIEKNSNKTRVHNTNSINKIIETSLNKEQINQIIKLTFSSLGLEKYLDDVMNIEDSEIINIFLNFIKQNAEKTFGNMLKNIMKFIDSANEFFKENGKKIEWSYNKMNIIVIDGKNEDKEINNYVFSSGEKNIITILFNLFFHEKINLLILMDEPEISLSIPWQENLFKIIDENPNTQVIAVTHSPFVVPEKKYKEYLKEF